MLATARLRRAVAALAADGATFWIVRPEVGLEQNWSFHRITGPEIQMLVRPTTPEFVGLRTSRRNLNTKGWRLPCTAPAFGAISPPPIFYRGRSCKHAGLSLDATGDVQVSILQRTLRWSGMIRSSGR